MKDFITVVEVEGNRADFIQSVLESHGLTVFVENANASNMLPFLTVLAKVQVPQDQVDKALEVLGTIPPQSEDPEDIELED